MVLAALPARVKTAAGVALLAGVFGVFHVLQLFGVLRRIDGILGAFPTLMSVASLATVAASLLLFRAQRRAPWIAIGSGALPWVTSSIWFLFAAANGFVTLFGFLVPFLGSSRSSWRSFRAKRAR